MEMELTIMFQFNLVEVYLYKTYILYPLNAANTNDTVIIYMIFILMLVRWAMAASVSFCSDYLHH